MNNTPVKGLIHVCWDTSLESKTQSSIILHVSDLELQNVKKNGPYAAYARYILGLMLGKDREARQLSQSVEAYHK